MLELKRHLAATQSELQRFGALFAILTGLLAAYLFWAGSAAWPAPATAAAVFLVMRLTMPLALRPFYVAWMALGSVLAWLNTRIVLGVVFYLLLTPAGLVMRFLGKDILGLRIDREAESYWVARSPDGRGRERYEQMF